MCSNQAYIMQKYRDQFKESFPFLRRTIASGKNGNRAFSSIVEKGAVKQI